MTNQAKNNNLSYLIDPAFTKINRLLVLSFENEEDRASFFKNYLPNAKIKDFHLLINGKSFFDMPAKNIKETYQKLLRWEEIMITPQVIYWITSTF